MPEPASRHPQSVPGTALRSAFHLQTKFVPSIYTRSGGTAGNCQDCGVGCTARQARHPRRERNSRVNMPTEKRTRAGGSVSPIQNSIRLLVYAPSGNTHRSCTFLGFVAGFPCRQVPQGVPVGSYIPVSRPTIRSLLYTPQETVPVQLPRS